MRFEVSGLNVMLEQHVRACPLADYMPCHLDAVADQHVELMRGKAIRRPVSEPAGRNCD